MAEVPGGLTGGLALPPLASAYVMRNVATAHPAMTPAILELLFLVGGYLCLAAVLNSIGLQGTLPESSRRNPTGWRFRIT